MKVVDIFKNINGTSIELQTAKHWIWSLLDAASLYKAISLYGKIQTFHNFHLLQIVMHILPTAYLLVTQLFRFENGYATKNTL